MITLFSRVNAKGGPVSTGSIACRTLVRRQDCTKLEPDGRQTVLSVRETIALDDRPV